MSKKRSKDHYRPAAHESRYVEAGGIRLHYLDYGTEGRPTMLCVHGGAANAHWFDFVAGNFCMDYHVLALDQRGHGNSGWANPPDYSYVRLAADIAEAADRLDLRDFVLVGHSLGGNVALEYAATYPGRVARLVVVDSTIQMTADRVAALHEVGTRRPGGYASREDFVARYRLRPAGNTAAPEILRHVAEHGCRQEPDGTWRHKFDRHVFATRRVTEGLPNWIRIRIPALLVKAARSQRLSPAVHAEVKARCPQVELTEVPDCDHHVMLDNPAGFATAVRAFLTKPRLADDGWTPNPVTCDQGRVTNDK